MPREHIEFVQAQRLPWVEEVTLVPRTSVHVKLLSEDQESGARTAIVRYPAGQQVRDAYALACDEEIYVLSGSMHINDNEFIAGDYACLPAGYERRLTVAASGCDVLSCCEAAPSIRGPGDTPMNRENLIEHVRTSDMPWSSPTDATMAEGGAGRKPLRHHARTGERSWLLKLSVDDGRPFEINAVETHPCVEEAFLLDGEIALREGVLRTGAYFWRPPDIPHGPMGTRGGFVGFFRAKEGEFSTVWSKAECDIPWDANYDPVLPDSIRQILTDGGASETRY